MNRTALLALASALCCASITGTALAQRRGAGPGQAAGEVSGTIVDGATGGPLANATVALRNSSDSSLVTGAIAEKDGGFALTGLRPGEYYARISFVGYVTRLVNVSIRPSARQLSLGKIVLAPDSSLRNEVAVTARRDFMSVAIDRTIYKTDDLLVSSGGTATDVLRNLPQVEVDADGNVSLRGNQNVAIQVNGRPMLLKGQSLAAFLRSLPADVVERIEVVTNPSAKYDPEGMGGILNIVLKQGTDRGLSGSVSGSTGTTNNHNIGVNLGYGAGPWNLFGGYAFSYGGHDGSGERYRENYLPGVAPIITQSSTNENRFPSHTLNLSADYTAGKAGTISLASVITARDGNGSGLTSTIERDLSGNLTSGYTRGDESTNRSFGADNRLGYKLVLEPGRHELSAELRYSIDDDDDGDAYLQTGIGIDGSTIDSLPIRQNVTQTDRHRTYSMQADYTRPLWEGGRLESGYKGEREATGGDYASESFDHALGEFRPDLSLNNSFDYTRTIHALYANLGQDVGDFGAQVGVRVEQVNTDFELKTTGASYLDDYFSAYPSAFLTYKASDALQLKASYSKRVHRPWINALNPFIIYDDPQFRRSGNPFLKPEYTDSYEFTASYYADGASLTLTPFYRYTTDVLRRWELVDSTGISTFTFVNFDENKSYGADLIGTARVGDWLNAFASVSAYQTVTDAGNIQDDLGSDGFVWSVRANATFTLPAGFDVQTSVFYRAPMVIEGGRMEPWTMIDLAVQKRLFNDRGRVGLRVSDPFKLMGFNVYHRDELYYQSYDRSWDSRGLFLTFSYSFGSQDPAQQRRSRPQPSAPSEPEMDMGG